MNTVTHLPMIMEQMVSFVACSPPATVRQSGNKSDVIIAKETNMHTYNHDESARQALRSVAWSARSKHRDAGRKHFHMDDDCPPQTGEELIDRLKEGRYILLDKNSRGRYDGPMGHFKWRHPDHKQDEAGYDAFRTKLEDAMAAVSLDIEVDPLDKSKAAVRKFEKETFH